MNAVLWGPEPDCFAVGVRWESCMNRKMSYQNAGIGGWNSGLPATWAMEAEADSRNFKIALLAALMIHILLLWVVFPSANSGITGPDHPIKKPPVRFIVMPPVQDDLPDIVLKPHVKKIPIPDVTPDGPELPVTSINTVTDPDMPVDYSENVVVPEPDPMDQDTKGLTAPVYDMAQLQQNLKYPRLGLLARMEGTVIVQVILNRDGTISDVNVSGGTLTGMGFPEAAEAAVRQLDFTPGMFHGNPVSVVMNLTIHFRLRR